MYFINRNISETSSQSKFAKGASNSRGICLSWVRGIWGLHTTEADKTTARGSHTHYTNTHRVKTEVFSLMALFYGSMTVKG